MMRNLLFVVVAVAMVLAVTEASRANKRRTARPQRIQRQQRQMLRFACKVLKADNTEKSSQACADGKLCNQGPIEVNLENGTKGKATFCQGTRLKLKKVANVPRGVCKMTKEGVTDPVFTWNCKRDTACDCGPKTIQFGGDSVQAHFCRKPRADSNGQHPCPRRLAAAGGGGGGRVGRRGGKAGRRIGARRRQRQHRQPHN